MNTTELLREAVWGDLSSGASRNILKHLDGREAELLFLAQREKVLPKILRLLNEEGRTPPSLKEPFGRLIARQQDWCSKVFDVLPSECIVLKGPTLLSAKQSISDRYFVDIDVLAPSFDIAARAWERLVQIGLTDVSQSYIRFARRQDTVVGASLRFLPEKVFAGFYGVELHVGGFPLSALDLVAGEWIEAGSVQWTFMGRDLRKLDDVSLFCLMLTAFARKRVLIRDLLDVCEVTSRFGTDSDVRLLTFIREHRIERAIFEVIRQFKFWQPEAIPDVLTRLAELVKGDRRGAVNRRPPKRPLSLLAVAARKLAIEAAPRKDMRSHLLRSVLNSKASVALYKYLGVALFVRSQEQLNTRKMSVNQRFGALRLRGELLVVPDLPLHK